MGCGKIRYRRRIDAKIVLARIRGKDNPRRPKSETRIYRCRDCKGFHLTSQPT
jgi:hypothetical protein